MGGGLRSRNVHLDLDPTPKFANCPDLDRRLLVTSPRCGELRTRPVEGEPPEVAEADQLLPIDGSHRSEIGPLVRASLLAHGETAASRTPQHEVGSTDLHRKDPARRNLIARSCIAPHQALTLVSTAAGTPYPGSASSPAPSEESESLRRLPYDACS